MKIREVLKTNHPVFVTLKNERTLIQRDMNGFECKLIFFERTHFLRLYGKHKMRYIISNERDHVGR